MKTIKSLISLSVLILCSCTPIKRQESTVFVLPQFQLTCFEIHLSSGAVFENWEINQPSRIIAEGYDITIRNNKLNTPCDFAE